jgi:hypothetical protein
MSSTRDGGTDATRRGGESVAAQQSSAPVAQQSNAPPQGNVSVVVEANTPRQGPIRIMIDNMEWLEEEDDGAGLERILEQLVFAAGTMIAAESDHPAQMDRILDGFHGVV